MANPFEAKRAVYKPPALPPKVRTNLTIQREAVALSILPSKSTPFINRAYIGNREYSVYNENGYPVVYISEILDQVGELPRYIKIFQIGETNVTYKGSVLQQIPIMDGLERQKIFRYGSTQMRQNYYGNNKVHNNYKDFHNGFHHDTIGGVFTDFLALNMDDSVLLMGDVPLTQVKTSQKYAQEYDKIFEDNGKIKGNGLSYIVSAKYLNDIYITERTQRKNKTLQILSNIGHTKEIADMRYFDMIALMGDGDISTHAFESTLPNMIHNTSQVKPDDLPDLSDFALFPSIIGGGFQEHTGNKESSLRIPFSKFDGTDGLFSKHSFFKRRDLNKVLKEIQLVNPQFTMNTILSKENQNSVFSDERIQKLFHFCVEFLHDNDTDFFYTKDESGTVEVVADVSQIVKHQKKRYEENKCNFANTSESFLKGANFVCEYEDIVVPDGISITDAGNTENRYRNYYGIIKFMTDTFLKISSGQSVLLDHYKKDEWGSLAILYSFFSEHLLCSYKGKTYFNLPQGYANPNDCLKSGEMPDASFMMEQFIKIEKVLLWYLDMFSTAKRFDPFWFRNGDAENCKVGGIIKTEYDKKRTPIIDYGIEGNLGVGVLNKIPMWNIYSLASFSASLSPSMMNDMSGWNWFKKNKYMYVKIDNFAPTKEQKKATALVQFVQYPTINRLASCQFTIGHYMVVVNFRHKGVSHLNLCYDITLQHMFKKGKVFHIQQQYSKWSNEIKDNFNDGTTDEKNTPEFFRAKTNGDMQPANWGSVRNKNSEGINQRGGGVVTDLQNKPVVTGVTEYTMPFIPRTSVHNISNYRYLKAAQTDNAVFFDYMVRLNNFLTDVCRAWGSTFNFVFMETEDQEKHIRYLYDCYKKESSVNYEVHIFTRENIDIYSKLGITEAFYKGIHNYTDFANKLEDVILDYTLTSNKLRNDKNPDLWNKNNRTSPTWDVLDDYQRKVDEDYFVSEMEALFRRKINYMQRAETGKMTDGNVAHLKRMHKFYNFCINYPRTTFFKYMNDISSDIFQQPNGKFVFQLNGRVREILKIIDIPIMKQIIAYSKHFCRAGGDNAADSLQIKWDMTINHKHNYQQTGFIKPTGTYENDIMNQVADVDSSLIPNKYPLAISEDGKEMFEYMAIPFTNFPFGFSQGFGNTVDGDPESGIPYPPIDDVGDPNPNQIKEITGCWDNVGELIDMVSELANESQLFSSSFTKIVTKPESAFTFPISYDVNEKIFVILDFRGHALIGTNKAIYIVQGNTADTTRSKKIVSEGVSYVGSFTLENSAYFISGDRKKILKVVVSENSDEQYAKQSLQFASSFFNSGIKSVIGCRKYAIIITEDGNCFRIHSQQDEIFCTQISLGERDFFEQADYYYYYDDSNIRQEVVLFCIRVVSDGEGDDALIFMIYNEDTIVADGEYADKIGGVETPYTSGIESLDYDKIFSEYYGFQINSASVSGKNIENCQWMLYSQDESETMEPADLVDSDSVGVVSSNFAINGLVGLQGQTVVIKDKLHNTNGFSLYHMKTLLNGLGG